jgi:hypothetical protein
MGSGWSRKEKIESSSEGAVARQGQHQVIFANNLNTSGAIDQQTPDGKRLRSNILGLSYYDNTTGKSVQIALVQDSQGELISDNQVLYPNAFDGVKADVCYTYRKGSFEQDVILREQPPTPESLGLNSASTELEVITEFLDAPPAAVKGRKGTGGRRRVLGCHATRAGPGFFVWLTRSWRRGDGSEAVWNDGWAKHLAGNHAGEGSAIKFGKSARPVQCPETAAPHDFTGEDAA